MRASAWVSWRAYPIKDDLEVVPPIDPNCTVEIMCRNGQQWVRKACSLWWHELPSEGQIVAYRIVWVKP